MFNFHSSFSYNESHLVLYYLLLIRFSSLVLSVLIQENGREWEERLRKSYLLAVKSDGKLNTVKKLHRHALWVELCA